MPGYRLRTTLPYALAQDGAWWVARCGLLKSVGQGRTERSAVRNLKDAIALKVQRAIERRRLAGILAGYGFHVVRVGRHVYWAAQDQHPDLHKLELNARLDVEVESTEEPAPTEATVPSDLPWFIDGRFRAAGAGRTRAA